jgi:hypothetical protein
MARNVSSYSSNRIEVSFSAAVKDSTATGSFCAWVPFFVH